MKIREPMNMFSFFLSKVLETRVNPLKPLHASINTFQFIEFHFYYIGMYLWTTLCLSEGRKQAQLN
ncbi:MAG TPA: hypothetical protein DD730_09620 [Desulfosporosinus sp.]|nr:hypothetical protein [Desulfosporosinus sp.]